MWRISRRPPWPAPVLVDLAACRTPPEVALSGELIEAALEHRMGGLLWTWVRDTLADDPYRASLAMHDLRVQAHLARVRALLERCVASLDDIGVDVAAIKGPTTEARWYRRTGERPTSDVDLWLSPHQLHRAGDAVRALQPDHPWSEFVGELAASRQLQAVTLTVDRIQVDLHLDLLKTGLPMRGACSVWGANQTFQLPSGSSVRVLDETSALLHFLVHLNKDRFQRLLGYADVARIIERGVDWPQLVRAAEREGLLGPVLRSLAAVIDDLRLDWPSGLPTPADDDLLWRLLWRPRVRLRGSEGRRRFRRRQLALIPLASRSWTDKSRALVNQIVPPAPVMEAAGDAYPLRKLLTGTARKGVERAHR